MESIAIDFLAISGILSALIAPPVFSFVKNLGFRWPEWMKLAAVAVFAAVAAFVGIGVTEGWGTVNLADYDLFWKPLIAGMAINFPIQYAAFKALWQGTKPEVALAAVGNNY